MKIMKLAKGSNSIELKLSVPLDRPSRDDQEHRARSGRSAAAAGLLLRYARPGPEPGRRGRPGPAHPGRWRRHGDQAAPGGPVHHRPGDSPLGGVQGRGRRDAGRLRLLGVRSRAFARGQEVLDVSAGTLALRKIFSKEQRAFYDAHAPAGVTMDKLAILGPTFLLKARHQPKDFDRRITVEMWLYPDGARILEISTKCLPEETFTGRRRVQGLPRRPWHRSRRRAGAEDQDRAGLLQRQAEARRAGRLTARRALRGRAAQAVAIAAAEALDDLLHDEHRLRLAEGDYRPFAHRVMHHQ